jgi:hypothetical protein
MESWQMYARARGKSVAYHAVHDAAQHVEFGRFGAVKVAQASDQLVKARVHATRLGHVAPPPIRLGLDRQQTDQRVEYLRHVCLAADAASAHDANKKGYMNSGHRPQSCESLIAPRQAKHTGRGETRHGLAKIGEEGQRANVGAPRAPVLADESGRRLGGTIQKTVKVLLDETHVLLHQTQGGRSSSVGRKCCVVCQRKRVRKRREDRQRTLSSTLVGGKLAGVANGSAANLTESASARLFKKFRNTSWKSDEAMPASMRAATV